MKWSTSASNGSRKFQRGRDERSRTNSSTKAKSEDKRQHARVLGGSSEAEERGPKGFRGGRLGRRTGIGETSDQDKTETVKGEKEKTRGFVSIGGARRRSTGPAKKLRKKAADARGKGRERQGREQSLPERRLAKKGSKVNAGKKKAAFNKEPDRC